MTSHTVYNVDNYFTSFRLIDELSQAGHDCTGTIRADRVEKAPLINPKELKKQPRGSYDQVTDQETNITLVTFNDNRVVTVASNRAGVSPMGKRSRWSHEEKKKKFLNSQLVYLFTTCISCQHTNPQSE